MFTVTVQFRYRREKKKGGQLRAVTLQMHKEDFPRLVFRGAACEGNLRWVEGDEDDAGLCGRVLKGCPSTVVGHPHAVFHAQKEGAVKVVSLDGVILGPSCMPWEPRLTQGDLPSSIQTRIVLDTGSRPGRQIP